MVQREYSYSAVMCLRTCENKRYGLWWHTANLFFIFVGILRWNYRCAEWRCSLLESTVGIAMVLFVIVLYDSWYRYGHCSRCSHTRCS